MECSSHHRGYWVFHLLFRQRRAWSLSSTHNRSAINLPPSTTVLRPTNHPSAQSSKPGTTEPTAQPRRLHSAWLRLPWAGPSAINTSSYQHADQPRSVCLLYLAKYSAWAVPLPVYKTFEVLGVYLHGVRWNLLVIIVYTNPVRRLLTVHFSTNLTISSSAPLRFTDCYSHWHQHSPGRCRQPSCDDVPTFHDLLQHITGPTHIGDHAIDVLIRWSDVTVSTLIIEEPVILDHSFISVKLELQCDSDITKVAKSRRWHNYNQDNFMNNLVHACYDKTLRSLVDNNAPLAKTTICSRPSALWYDASCVNVKVNTRHLERLYHAHRTPTLFDAWLNQSRYLRFYLQERYREYWMNTISMSMSNSKALWSQVSGLL